MSVDAQINFGNVVAGSPTKPAAVNGTYFYARWTGYIIPSVTGVYTLGLNVQDGANLFIAGTPIINNLSAALAAHTSAAYNQSGTIELTAGVYYPITVEWQHGSGSPYQIQLLWTPPGGSVAVVPSANLSTSKTSVTGNLTGSWWNGTSGLWFPTGPGMIDFASTQHANKTIDNVPDGAARIGYPNAPTNRNLIPDSGFKTWNSNALYWVPSSWVLLPGMGADGGNAIGYLGTGSPSGFPEAGLRKNPILLAPGNYTLSAYMDATFVTSSALDMGLYLSIGSSGAPTALDGGPFHNTQNPGQKGRKFTNFTVAIRTRTNGMSVAVNDLILDSNGNLQACTVAGTLAGSAPTWSAVLGNNTTDGTATWRLINLAANMPGGVQVPFNLLLFPSNATVTAGKYAVISNPQLEPTPPSNTPTPYKENPGDDTTGTMLIDLSNVKHAPMTNSTLLIPQGSIVPMQAIAVPSYSTSTSGGSSSITFSSSSQSVMFSDGVTRTITFAGASYTGLTPGATYFFYPYVRMSDLTIQFANANPPGTSANASVAIQAALDGRENLTVFTVTTPSSTGSGSGGGGFVCPEQNELVDVEGRGQVPAKEVTAGDRIKGRSIKNETDVYRPVIGIHVAPCAAWYIVQGRKVTPCEPVWNGSAWIPAFKMPGAVFNGDSGVRVGITVQSDDYDESNFYIYDPDGSALLIHNGISGPIGGGGC